MFKACTSYSEQSTQVSELAEACAVIKSKLRYSAPDARRVALENVTGVAREARVVLTAVGLPLDRMEILNTPARIRNSLHANGIHHRQHPGETARVTINGVLYEFIDRNPVTCASWEHIAHALKSSHGRGAGAFRSTRLHVSNEVGGSQG